MFCEPQTTYNEHKNVDDEKEARSAGTIGHRAERMNRGAFTLETVLISMHALLSPLP